MKKFISIPEALERAYKMNSEKEVLYDGYTRVTYGQLYKEAQLIASGLAQKGIQKGDRVIVCLPNWNEFVSLYFGLASLGAILVPCNTRYRADELSNVLVKSGAKAVFVAEEYKHAEFFQPFLNNNHSDLEHIFTVRFKQDDHLSLDDLLELGSAMPHPEVKIDPAEDVFSILYTSGTTGKPKGAMLTHSNFMYSAEVSNVKLKCTAEDVFLIAVPVFHVFGMGPGIMSAIAAGARMVLMDQYKAIHALELIEAERISVHHGVPTMFILELNHPRFSEFDLSSLRTGIIAAAPCPEEIVRKIRNDMGCNILVFYGLTESTASITATSFDDDDYIQSITVGRPLPDSEAKVVDAQGMTVQNNEVGELLLRGPGITKGYYQSPEQTIEAINHEGWFHTGDLATMDEKGYIRIVGRKKEMIIRGGFNIYPREIEEIFYKHPSVLEVVIIGLPDTVLGEVSCAAIKLKTGHDEDEGAMKDYIRDKVADYKVPDKIIFLDEFPMTDSGKIKRVALEKELRQQLQATLR
ncbi:class I adenylate-forming enzyme family protein [Bacillus tuaregi]|uniref:class I adenylate-forming enzyme family protein n=1 Tax=Bacillus tuaregi TaxID=1816695 RepID=UPI000A422AC7|nr:class I adenylate-forming enzyme family protein [Bacillus tuaregi]